MKNLCVITNKKVKWLERLIKKVDPNVCFLYSSIVYDRDCQSLRIREHDDGELYLFGNKLHTDDMDYIDCHEFYVEIPFGRYIYMNRKSQEDVKLHDKTIIAMPDKDDFESYLAISAFLKAIDSDQSRSIHCIEIDGTENVKNTLSEFIAGNIDLPYFETLFAELFNERREEGFVSHFPVSRDIRYLQNETHMTNIQFAAYFGTSIRNVENWRKDPDSMKDYLYDLFEYKLLKEGVI